MGSEVISAVGRRRWPREKSIEVLMEALAPGASVAAVANRHGVARNLVYTWLRLAREGRLDGVVPARRNARQPTFVPVDVAPAAATDGTTTEAASASVSASAPVLATSASASRRRRPSAVETRLGDGCVVKVDEGIDPAAFGAIVAALDGGGA